MRRGTLITIFVLLAAIAAMAIYQLVASGDRRFPGPGTSPTASPTPTP